MKLQKTNLETSNMWMPSSYPASGFYHNIDQVKTENIVYVNKTTGIVLGIGSAISDFQIFEEGDTSVLLPAIEEKTTDSSIINSEFALKVLAIVNNKEKYKDLT